MLEKPWAVLCHCRAAHPSIRAVERGNDLTGDPNRQLRGNWVYALQGQYNIAADQLDPSTIVATSASGRVAVERFNALAGRATNTRQLLADLIEESKQRYVPSTAIAELHAALGDNDAAFQWLEFAFTERSLLLLRVFVDPRWERYWMSADARFAALRRRIGLPFD